MVRKKKVTTIAITGASGFLGRRLIATLLDNQEDNQGYFLKVLLRDRDITVKSKYLKKYHGDLLNMQSLNNFVKGSDVIVHLAGSFYPPARKQLKLNLCGTINLLKVVDKNRHLKKLIFASTAAVYGENRKNKAFSEKDSVLPVTFYGLSKLLAEEVIRQTARSRRFTYSILRFSSIYGPGQRKGVFFNFIDSINKNNKIQIFGDGKQARDFLYIDDAIKAIYKVLKRKDISSEIFNVSGKRAYSLNEVAKMIKGVLNRSIEINYGVPEGHVLKHCHLSCLKAKKVLSWEAKVSLKKGLSKILKCE